MEFVIENLKSFKSIVSKIENTKYEWDIIVPDLKPDVGRIISADTTVEIASKEIMQDRAMINGTARINILYIPTDNKSLIKNVETIQSFNYVMELSGLRQNMTLNILPSSENTEVTIINSRKLHILSGISFFGSVTETGEISCVSEIKNDDILYKTKEIVTHKAISETDHIINISEELEIPVGKPSAGEILKFDTKINNKDVRPIHNKLVVKGELEIITIYNSEAEGDSVEYMCHEIPFAEIIDINDITENTICDTDFIIKNTKYNLKENKDGEKRIMVIDAAILVKSRNYEEFRMNTIIDAYSLKYELETEKNDYMVDEIINQSGGQFNVKDSVLFEDINDILKVISIGAKTDIKNVYTGNDKVNIKGDILCDILYLSSDNNEINKASGSIPFEHSIECTGATEDVICDLKLDIIKCVYNILSLNEIELRVSLDYMAIIKRDVLSELISNISYDETKPMPSDKNGLTVYFCSGRENIWDIAKKYRTTVECISKINKIDSENEIKSGMKLLIP